MLTLHSATRLAVVSAFVPFSLLVFTPPHSAVAQTPPPAELPSASPAPARPAQAPVPAAVPPNGQITIDIDVSDKPGHAIAGLTQADFTLFDNGQPVKPLDFQAVEAKGTTADFVHVIIVLDAINTPIITVAREREQLSEFLKQNGGELPNPTSIAFLADSGLKAATGSTRDGNALLGVLDKTQSELRSVGRSGGFWGDSERLQTSLTQLSQLAELETSQSGRKLMLFISPGWPLMARAGDMADMKQRTALFESVVSMENSLRQAHIVLYSIDPSNIGTGDQFYYQSFLKGITKPTQALYAHLALQVLAVNTGGLAQVTGNDILGELNRAFLDAPEYYTISFPAAAPGKNTEFHALRVQVDKPGTVVRTSFGYYVKGTDPSKY